MNDSDSLGGWARRLMAGAVMVGAVLVSSTSIASAAPDANAPVRSGAIPAATSTAQDEQRMREIIRQARTTDPVGFKERRTALANSDGFELIMRGASPKAERMYLDFFTAVSSDAEIARFVETTEGKFIAVSGSGADLSVEFVDTPPVTTYALDCWQATVASYSFFAATFAICGVVTIASGPGGVACALAFWGIGSLPDFNDACD